MKKARAHLFRMRMSDDEMKLIHKMLKKEKVKTKADLLRKLLGLPLERGPKE